MRQTPMLHLEPTIHCLQKNKPHVKLDSIYQLRELLKFQNQAIPFG